MQDLNIWKRENSTLQAFNTMIEDKVEAETAMHVIPLVIGKYCKFLKNC